MSMFRINLGQEFLCWYVTLNGFFFLVNYFINVVKYGLILVLYGSQMEDCAQQCIGNSQLISQIQIIL